MAQEKYDKDHVTKEIDYGVDVEDNLNTVCFSNDEGFARILKVYARPGYIIVDPTYGNGVFWKGIKKADYKIHSTDWKIDGTDMRNLPYDDLFADMVVIDPPYRYTPLKNKKHEDNPNHGKFDSLYNLQESKLFNTKSVLDLYFGGMIEAKRILKNGGILVVKCQDNVEAGKNIWVHNILMEKGEELDFACRDILIVHTKNPIKTRWNKQRHLRKSHSYFLVFRKGGHFPFGTPSICKRDS